MKGLQLLLASLVVAVALMILPSAAQAASAWDFSQNWDSGYSNGYILYYSYTPWATYSSYYGMTNYGGDTSQYNYSSYYYSAHMGVAPYGSYPYASSYYDYYLTYTWPSVTAGPGNLSFWWYVYSATLDMQYTTDGSTWVTLSTLVASATSTSGNASNIRVPAGTKKIRWHTNSYSYAYYYGAYIDNVVYAMDDPYVSSVTGFDPVNPNAGILNLTATAGTTYVSGITRIDFLYKGAGNTSFVLLNSDTTPADGFKATWDTDVIFDDTMILRVIAYANSVASNPWDKTVNIANPQFSSFGSLAAVDGQNIAVTANYTKPASSYVWPDNPWVGTGSGAYNYTIWNYAIPSPIAGTYSGYKTYFNYVSSNPTHKFKIFQQVSGNTFTCIATGPSTTTVVGEQTYTLPSGTEWTNVAAGSYIGCYMYYCNMQGYTGNTATNYYYSGEATGTVSASGPLTGYAPPVRAVMSKASAYPTQVQLGYSYDKSSVTSIGTSTGNGSGGYTVNWQSLGVIDDGSVWMAARGYNGFAYGKWYYSPAKIRVLNKVNVTLNTTMGEGVILFDGVSTTVPFVKNVTVSWENTYTYSVDAPQYQFDSNAKRWRWDSWSDGGARAHSMSITGTMAAANQPIVANYVRQYSYAIDSVRPVTSTLAAGWYDYGTEVTCSAEIFSVADPGRERFQCGGFEIVAQNRRENAFSATFNIDRDLILHWFWNAQHYFFSVNDLNSRTGDMPGWYGDGAQITSVVAVDIANGVNARQHCLGYTINGTWVPGSNVASFIILAATTVEWSWSQQFMLTTIANVGTIEPPTGWYDEGAEIDVTATPPASDNLTRYSFTEWKGAGAGSVKRVGGAPTASVTVNSPITETAVWKVEHHLILSSDLGSYSPDASGWYLPGTQVAINAVSPDASTGLRYLPDWNSVDPDGINEAATPDTPLAFPVTMNGPVRQNIDWMNQYLLTILNPDGLGLQMPAVGEYWFFAGELIYGVSQYVSGEKVCSGFTGTGSVESSSLPYFTGEIGAPTTITWLWRDRVVAPYFGVDPPADMPGEGAVALSRTSTGSPCAVYRKANSNLVYGVWGGTSWTETILETNVPEVNYVAFAFDESNNPVVVYQDSVTLNLVLLMTGVDTAPASSIYRQEIDRPGNDGINCHIAVAGNGEIFISAYSAEGYLYMIEVTPYGSVVADQTVDSEGNPGFYNAIGTNPLSNEPMVVYYDAFSRVLSCAWRNGDEWTFETVDNLGAVGSDVAMAVGKSGDLYVGYRDITNADATSVKYAYRTINGWHISSVDKYGSVGRGLSISLSGDEYPNLAYFSPDSIRMSRNTGSQWEMYTLARGISPPGTTAITSGADARAFVAINDGGQMKVIVAKEGAMAPDNVSDGGGGYVPGGSTSSGGGGGCFIATAAFGSLACGEVSALTSMRDGLAYASSYSGALVGAYYAVSPALASRESDAIRAVIRSLLSR